MINSWNVDVVKAEDVNFTFNIKYPHIIKELIEENNATLEQVSPQTFYSLVMNRPSCYKSAMSNTP